MRIKFIIVALLPCFIVSLFWTTTANAQDFNPHYILSNTEMTDYASMGMFDIVQFIKNKGGTLYTARFEDIDGKTKSAPALIYNAAKNYEINPKVLLVTLQKEQSLVDNPAPTQKNYDWATGWAVCDGCSLSDPKVAKYKGFAKQIDGTAGGYNWYLEQFASGGNTWLIWPKKTTTIDNESVTPANEATAALYNYTPHLHGNENFWKLWDKWFSINYPDDSLLQTEGEDGVWLIQNGYRRPFKSKAAFISSYDINNILLVSKTEIEKFPAGKEIKFANYSLLRSPAGTIYLLVDDNLRGIQSMEVFRTIGFNLEEVIKVTNEDLQEYTEIEPITMESAYPTGALLQNRQTGGVYYVRNGAKQGLIDRSVMDINFKGWHITPVTTEELSKYPNLPPVKIKDGKLIKSETASAVYVISDGQRRPITSAETFEKMGYKWKNILSVPQKVVDLHEEGEVVSVAY
ncbi:hypothetical protein KKD19_07125 [Patescibacteria group bacterium]|nr:hypothetical protein [Patescibacteria group bacterium]MBU4512976.1 hypothetical protein [Patescibacteria group bacterium]MCG2693012.1 hypothetical protein [Candidatus Parcubacteria bacterium]